MNKESLARAVVFLQTEMQIVTATVKEKGLQRFSRPLVLGLAAVFASYYLYGLTIKRSAVLAKRMVAAKASAQYADTYKGLRDRLFSVYAFLPALSDRDMWLTNTANDTLVAQSIVPDSMRPPAEAEDVGLVAQKLSISMHGVKFMDLAAWLSRVENTRPLLHVASLEVTKRRDKDHLGQNDISCSLSTLIPTQRLGQ